MSTPLFYILAPFGLAFALFAVFLIVSIFLKDPARPFRMFAAPPLKGSPESKVHPSTSSGQGSPEENEEEDGSEGTENTKN
jgi:hypothetical protein